MSHLLKSLKIRFNTRFPLAKIPSFLLYTAVFVVLVDGIFYGIEADHVVRIKNLKSTGKGEAI